MTPSSRTPSPGCCHCSCRRRRGECCGPRLADIVTVLPPRGHALHNLAILQQTYIVEEMSERPLYGVIEDAIWQALDSEQGMPHSGVDPAYVIPEFLRLLHAAGYAVVPIKPRRRAVRGVAVGTKLTRRRDVQ